MLLTNCPTALIVIVALLEVPTRIGPRFVTDMVKSPKESVDIAECVKEPESPVTVTL
jgi:hypothetical protein